MTTRTTPAEHNAGFRAWLPVLGLAVLCFFLFFFQLGSYPLFDVDEPRYAEAAREMIERGDWITPYFNYELRFDKPVFFYWLIALAYQVFGISEFSARFFSAAMATSMVFALYAAARNLAGPRLGLYSALILATSIEVVGLARMSITDMTLSTLMGLTTLCLLMIPHRSLKWWLAAGFFAGLSVLTKGPVGIVIPGGIFFLYALVIGEWKRCFLNRWFPMALVLFAALALPWYVMAYQVNGQIFLDALVLHNVDRFQGVVSGHTQPPYFFYLVLLVGFLPWSPFLPVSLVYWFKAIKNHHRAWLQDSTNLTYRLFLFGLVWSLLVFVFFNVAQTKLLTYILPMFPGLALCMAATFIRAETVTQPEVSTVTSSGASAQTSNNSPDQNAAGLLAGLRWTAWIYAGVLAVAGIFFVTRFAAFLPREASEISGGGDNIVLILTLVLGTGLVAWFLTQRNIRRALLAQALAIGVLAVFVVLTLLPRVNHATQGDMLAFVEAADGKPLATYEIKRPSLTFYTRKKVYYFRNEERGTLQSILESQGGLLYVITKNRFVERLEALAPEGVRLHRVTEGPIYSLVLFQKPQ